MLMEPSLVFPSSMPRTVLLAEDNEDDAFFFHAAAKRSGWTHAIEVARDGREAIAALERFAAAGAPSRLGLVLLDLKMPFLGGLDVLAWAKERPEFCSVPMCVLSSSEQESDIESAYRLGAASFLVKPANPDGLLELLRSIDAYWLRHNRLPRAVFDRARSEVPR